MVEKPGNLEWRMMNYDELDEQLNVTDWEAMVNKSLPAKQGESWTIGQSLTFSFATACLFLILF